MIKRAITVGVNCTTCSFNHIDNPIVIAIGIKIISNIIAISVSRLQSIINTISICILTASNRRIHSIVNPISVRVHSTQGWTGGIFDTVCKPVIIRIGITTVDNAISVGVTITFHSISNTVVIIVKIIDVWNTITIGIKFDGIARSSELRGVVSGD